MKINTCYTVDIKSQYIFKDGQAVGIRRVDEAVMKATRTACLDALKFCVNAFLSDWDSLEELSCLMRKRRGDLLIHSTKNNIAAYQGFDESFPYLPSYMRRAIVADALGIVSSYVSNHRNWERLSVFERGSEPKVGYPTAYELTFYDQDRILNLSEGSVGLKLYSGKEWKWYYFRIGESDARYIAKMAASRKLLSPVVEKSKGRYRIRFCFEESRKLIQNEDPFVYTVLAVDLGINAPASWCVMTAEGSVHARGVIRLVGDEDRLRHAINRKRMYQQAGKKSHSIYRRLKHANELLAINTAREIIKTAVLYDVDCIVFEHLDLKGSKVGRRMKERLHLWCADNIQDRVELHAHRNGMRISRVCAWGTSMLAFDGTGRVQRGMDAGLGSYSVCRFQTGKIYNCDLNASYNIGARYFLREYKKLPGCPELPKTSRCILADLRNLISAYPALAA